ncbi:MAG: hypothetical protein CL607_05765 [Anaerolineaceae bacterium]|nr:hypothetical protein [Anaerolineaceae bacterium]
MKWLARLFALMLVPCAILFFLLAAMDLAMSRAIFNADTYRAALSREQVYQELVPNLLSIMVDDAHNNPQHGFPFDLATLSERLDDDDWHTITADLIPPTWIGEQVDLVIAVIDGVTRGQFGIIDQPIDLRPLKNSLTGPPKEAAVDALLATLPACSDDEVATMQQFFSGGDLLMPMCQPPETLYDAAASRISTWIESIGAQLPETVTLSSLDVEAIDLQAMNLLVNINQQGIALLFVCPLAILSLIVLLVVQSLRSFGRWTGGIIMLSGLMVLVSLLGLQAITLNSLTANWQLADAQERFIGEIILALMRSAFLSSSATLLVIAAIFFSVGFVLLLMSIYGPSHDDNASAALHG